MSVTRDERSGFESLRVPQILPRTEYSDQIAMPSRGRDAALEWLAVAERVGEIVELDASAHAHAAMLRRRGVPTATRLLCLALLYGPGHMPLRMIAERAQRTNIAHVSEPALLRRLANAAPWLNHVASMLIRTELQRLADPMAVLDRAESARAEQDRRTQEVEMARAFILDFVPWGVDVFSEQQVHWLLCVRWNYVAATLKDGSQQRGLPEMQSMAPMDRTRRLAHLIAAAL